MTEPLQPQIRKTALAAANYHVALAGVVLANAGVPKDSEELKLLREVVRLLRLRAPDHQAAGVLEGAAPVVAARVPPPSPK